MKVLFGPLSLEERQRLLPLPRGGHDVEFFDFNAPTPVLYRPGDLWTDLLSRLPAGWRPDVVVWWLPEYRPWPVRDECPLPLVAVPGDWYHNFSALREVLGRCDYIASDRACAGLLRTLGYENAEPWPGVAFDPRQHRSYPDLRPCYDVLFVGSLDHALHRHRARLLARLASLSDRYTVAILYGVWGEEYARTLARSRIVVNHTVRGTMNMRAFEAPACGTLLFVERENIEVRDYFRDGVECVLYGEDDLEALLERYLSDEPLRARVAAAGHARVQTETYAAHFQWLLDRLSELDWVALRRHRQRWARLSAAQQHYYNGRWLLTISPLQDFARQELLAAVQLAPDEPEYANATAVAEAMLALVLQRSGRRADAEACAMVAERRWQTLLSRWPDEPLAWANLGLAQLMWGKTEVGANALHEAFGLLRAASRRGLPRDGCPFAPASLETFRVEWERAVAEHVGDHTGTLTALGALLRWECARRVGNLALEQGLARRALELFDEAIAARPDLEDGQVGRGRVLEALGQSQDAITAYKAALERQPWDFPSRRRVALQLYLNGESEDCAAVCREGLALARACPPYRDAARPLESLLAQVTPVGAAEGEGA